MKRWIASLFARRSRFAGLPADLARPWPVYVQHVFAVSNAYRLSEVVGREQ